MARRPFTDSLYFALSGLVWAWQTQGNVRRHTVAAVVAVALAHLLALSLFERALIILTIALVIATELVNTAIEAIIDLCNPYYHPLAKRAKDVAAAAVLVTALAAVAVGLWLFGPPLSQLFAFR
ncbi:MAG: diacylglycerol kinase family protein [Firmicutes bacterium]|nr:diacylglycerol kinase family protein [Bacillota bacterium]